MLGSMHERYSPATCSLEVAWQLMLLLCHTAAGPHILCAGWQPCLRRPPSLGCWSTRPAPREVQWAPFWLLARCAAASNARTRAQSALSEQQALRYRGAPGSDDEEHVVRIGSEKLRLREGRGRGRRAGSAGFVAELRELVADRVVGSVARAGRGVPRTRI